MNIVGVQLNIVWEDKAANHAKLAAWLAAEPPPPGALIVLPEMWATGFSMNVAEITETSRRETEALMSALAAQYQVGLLGGVVTTGADGRGWNEAVFFGSSGEAAARYSKMHPFTLGMETQHYGRGSDIVLFEWQGMTVAPFICYDLRFPEVFRHAARRGAEIFCVIASWPEARQDHWVTLLKARAIENQAYVVGVNRSGRDPNLNYPGRSMVYGPRGEVLADAGTDEGTLPAHLDGESLRAYRREFPFLDDIHPDYR